MAAAPDPAADLLFETTDCDQAGEYMTQVYGADVRMTGSKDGYSFRYARLATSAFTIDSGTLSHSVAFSVEPLPVLVILYAVDMNLLYRYEGAERRLGPRDVFLTSTSEGSGLPYMAQWRRGTLQAAALPFTTLGQVAATAETRHDTPVRLTSVHPTNPVAAQHLTNTIDYLAGALRHRPDAMREPLVAHAAARLLAATVLTAFPNTAETEPTIEDRHDSHPRSLRQAIAFIDDHAHLDISVADIAAAAHVTVRAVQYAFRRHLGSTPMDYLRQARLHHVHRELLAADPTTGVTITQIAARWGFFHPGRFAGYYRENYGHPPRQTLLRDAP